MFTHFGNLVGGRLNDTFVFTNNASAVSINGGAGTNIVDYSSTSNTNALSFDLNNSFLSTISKFIGPTNISGNNTLIGANSSSNTWNITSNNGGNINNNAITFSNFGNLTGGTAGDVFVLANSSVSVSGVISNGSLNYSSYNNTVPVNVNLAAGTATATGGISNITNITGGSAINTITGANTANTWNITGTNAGNVNGTSFTHFSQLVGGTAGNIFAFNNGASVSTINGGIGGVNTLDYSAYSAPITVNLSTSTASGLTGVFSNITNLNANSSNIASNNLIGQNASNVWAISANNGGNINGTTTFSNFGNLTGGTGNDTFTFNDGKVIAGIIDGGANGTNILDLSNYSTAVGITLSSATASGYSGTTTGTPNPTGGFARITQVNGGASNGSANTSLSTENTLTTVTLTGNNSGTLNDGTATLTFNTIGTLVGGTANNKLIGTNNATTWNITGNNAGNVNSVINFSGFGNLAGGSANDSFIFSDGASISGAINGGGGSNSLDYSAYTTPVTVNLASGLISNINNIIGSMNLADGQNNSLYGPNATVTWNILGNNTGTLNYGSMTISFTNFGNLIGGIFNDNFYFATNGNLSGSINGGAGTNSINYSNYTAPVTVNLAQLTASGLSGLNSISQITQYIANNNNAITNTIIGNNTMNNWQITNNNSGNINKSVYFNGFGNLTGGTSTDIFTFLNNISVSGMVNGGGGDNTLNYSNYSSPVNVNLTNQTATGTGGFNNINHFTGGTVTITP